MVTLSERKNINKQTNAFCMMDKLKKRITLATDVFFLFLSVAAVRSFTQSICVCWTQLLMRGFGNSNANVCRQG